MKYLYYIIKLRIFIINMRKFSDKIFIRKKISKMKISWDLDVQYKIQFENNLYLVNCNKYNPKFLTKIYNIILKNIYFLRS